MGKIENTKLANGVEIPYVGLGTFRSNENELVQAVKSAIEIGYTSFDTAWAYKNEREVASGIKASGRKREDFFITTKLANELQGYDSTLKAFDDCLNMLDTDYIDLYLIHWPGKDKFIDTWKAFEKLYKEKRVRAIGVSNFLRHHLDTLISNCEIMPMVEQLETHPYFFDNETIEYCQNKSILVEAWSPLGFRSDLLNDQTLKDIGKDHGKTPAQVSLRFLIQNSIRVIPKSVHVDRQKQNMEVFDFNLNEKEIDAIKALNAHKRLGPDPDTFFI